MAKILKNIWIRIFMVWFLFIPIAVLNGIVRDLLYKPIVGDVTAHQISTLIAVLAFFLLAFSFMKNHITSVSVPTALTIGLVWLSMTILFEFYFGYFVDHKSWEYLLGDYNVFRGRLWPLFLLAMSLTPVIIKYLRRKKVILHET